MIKRRSEKEKKKPSRLSLLTTAFTNIAKAEPGAVLHKRFREWSSYGGVNVRPLHVVSRSGDTLATVSSDGRIFIYTGASLTPRVITLEELLAIQAL